MTLKLQAVPTSHSRKLTKDKNGMETLDYPRIIGCICGNIQKARYENTYGMCQRRVLATR